MAKPEFPTKLVSVFAIRMDGGTHARAGLSESVVARYADKMGRKVKFPSIVVFYDGTHHWLADGFHRVLAAIKTGQHRILAEIRSGTQRDARSFSCGANTDHGEGRSKGDDRVAVLLMLQDWPTWTNTRIARHCHVSEKTIRNVKKTLPPPSSDAPKMREAERGGRTYLIDTSAIGRPSLLQRSESGEDMFGVKALQPLVS